MSIDKTIHYIGAQIVDHINSLTLGQLRAMKQALTEDISIPVPWNKQGTPELFKRTIELQYINQRLKNES